MHLLQRDVIEKLLNKSSTRTDKVKKLRAVKKGIKKEMEGGEAITDKITYIKKFLTDEDSPNGRLICLLGFPLGIEPIHFDTTMLYAFHVRILSN